MQKRTNIQKLIALIIVLALIGGLIYALSARRTDDSNNPFAERDEQSAHMLQQEALNLSLDSTALPPAETPSAAPEDSPAPESTPESTPEMPDLVTPNPDRTTLAPSRMPEATAATPRPDATATAGTGEDSQETKLIYFTTNLINGSTVSSPEVSLKITHKQAELSVKSETIALNGGVIPQFGGALMLSEGKNTIKITVVYEGAEGRQIQVAKTYTVYLVPDQLIITTDLSDRTVNQLSFSFTAYASIGSSRASIAAYLGDERLECSGNRFSARLAEGENVITLIATGNGNQIEQKYTIVAALPDNMEISTDLYDHEVDDPNFTFYASLAGGTERAALTVVANGQTLTGTAGSYSCVLSRGNNLIRLKATDVDGAEFTQSYTVSYHHYIIVDSEDADETMPRIATNLAKGMSVTGNRFTLQVRGESGSGQRLYGDHITVQLNGTTLEDRGEDEGVTYYRLDLIGGENSVVITVWDYEDRYTVYHYSIDCTAVADGEKIGSITISLEASTLGLGNLIAPTTVDIYQGQNLVVPVAQLLEANGYEYQYSGSLTDGFYLKHIIRSGITNGYAIPSDLEDALNDDGVMWTNSYRENSLGEFDFTAESGWMYSINGAYPNYGMSECFPKDGDVIRIRFTLALGKDIGGGMVGGGSSNYGKEW